MRKANGKLKYFYILRSTQSLSQFGSSRIPVPVMSAGEDVILCLAVGQRMKKYRFREP